MQTTGAGQSRAMRGAELNGEESQGSQDVRTSGRRDVKTPERLDARTPRQDARTARKAVKDTPSTHGSPDHEPAVSAMPFRPISAPPRLRGALAPVARPWTHPFVVGAQHVPRVASPPLCLAVWSIFSVARPTGMRMNSRNPAIKSNIMLCEMSVSLGLLESQGLPSSARSG